MTGSVEGTKDVAKVEDKAAEAAKSSPADLLKKAVAGKLKVKTEAAPAPDVAGSSIKPQSRLPLRVDARLAVVATVALVLGTSFGMVSAPRERSGEALARIEASLDAGRTEASRLNSEIERLTKTLVSLRDSSDATRSDVRATSAGLTDRMSRLEQGLDKKFAALADRVVHPERDQPATTPATIDKRASVPVTAAPTTSPAVAASTPKAEPTQTASITETKADTKPKTETVEAWALRDVYDGVAMLEDRKRRLLEVAPGDSVPGIGRVEAIERRGRVWVVVTKQGVITPQTW